MAEPKSRVVRDGKDWVTELSYDDGKSWSEIGRFGPDKGEDLERRRKTVHEIQAVLQDEYQFLGPGARLMLTDYVMRQKIDAQAELVTEMFLEPTVGIMDKGELFVAQEPLLKVWKRVLIAAGIDWKKLEAEANKQIGMCPQCGARGNEGHTLDCPNR